VVGARGLQMDKWDTTPETGESKATDDAAFAPPWVPHQQIANRRKVFRLVPTCRLSATTSHLCNHLCFQEHSCFKRLSTFFFIDIPASLPGSPSRSFVFIDIPASFRQF
jgi:hypothetical protein